MGGVDVADLPPDGETLPQQLDRAGWPVLRAKFAATFKSRTRDEWVAAFEGSDACFAPVLTFSEARADAHNVARGRSPGLLGKQRYARFVAAYESARLTSGRIPATYEVVYGHAWAPLADSGPGAATEDGSVRIPVARIGRRVRV